ncbi:hypothetical protein AMELA_G00168340 [Ameiurus melas]|uniref:Uncharacterized protein n=1 Tax=Ameiurus melas TaxID=219545 RepID=A0A7J6ADZ5_AMEME|nr:hypothetical protein AMELA_G00168340 [Ameiurus melas]
MKTLKPQQTEDIANVSGSEGKEHGLILSRRAECRIFHEKRRGEEKNYPSETGVLVLKRPFLYVRPSED